MTNLERGAGRGVVPWAVAGLLFAVACSSDGGNQDVGDGGIGPGSGGSSGSGGAPGGGGGAPGGSGGAPGGSGGTALDGGSGGAGGSGGLTTEALWSDFAGALCRHYFTCNDEGLGSEQLRALANPRECEAHLLDRLKKLSTVRMLNAAVGAGYLTIREDALSACLAAAEECNHPVSRLDLDGLHFEEITPCRQVFEGTVPLGGDCDLSAECAGDATCARSAASDCRGRCAARREAGADCSDNDDCTAPSPDQWPICFEGSCLVVSIEAPAAFGEPCGHENPGTAIPCDEGLYCPGAAAGVGQGDLCANPRAVGAECDPTDPYLSVCAEGYCDSTGHCAVYTVQQNANDPCDEGRICDSLSGLRCVDGLCTTESWPEGFPCDSRPWFDHLLCSPELLPEGESCVSGADCSSGVCDNTCKREFCSAG